MGAIPSRRRGRVLVYTDDRFHYPASRRDVDGHIISTSLSQPEHSCLLGSRRRERIVSARYAAHITVADPVLYELSERKEVDRDRDVTGEIDVIVVGVGYRSFSPAIRRHTTALTWARSASIPDRLCRWRQCGWSWKGESTLRIGWVREWISITCEREKVPRSCAVQTNA